MPFLMVLSMKAALKKEEISDMVRLAIAQNRIDDLDTELKEWKREKEEVLERILPEAEFGPDKFLKTIGKKGDAYRRDGYMLIRHKKTVRTVDTERFYAKFPDLARKICTIPTAKAEALAGKENMKTLCIEKVSFSYEVVKTTQK